MSYSGSFFGVGETLKEKELLLESVNKAISTLLEGGVQSYAIGKRNLTRLNLSELMKFRRTLHGEISAMKNDSFLLGNTKVTYFDRR